MSNSFELGRVVITRGLNNLIENSENLRNELNGALSRYFNCDWGDTCEDDKVLNDAAVKNNNDRIVAKYVLSNDSEHTPTSTSGGFLIQREPPFVETEGLTLSPQA